MDFEQVMASCHRSVLIEELPEVTTRLASSVHELQRMTDHELPVLVGTRLSDKHFISTSRNRTFVAALPIASGKL
jgi:hypothetical protein